jgi:HD-like signal output (HDOD) protein
MSEVCTAQSSDEPVFGFVSQLPRELSRGRVEIPAFPDIIVRVRDVLADENASIDRLVRIVGAEPALAARLLTMANSAACNPSGSAIRDLRAAVARLGQNLVRSATLSFAVEQMQKAAKLAPVRQQLAELWQQSTQVAAVCFYVARRNGRVNPDEALLAGLMHAVGKLYILGRADSHPELFADPPGLAQALRDWHASIGRAILENWGFDEDIVEAVGRHEEIDFHRTGSADLGDVLTVSVLMAAYSSQPTNLELNMQGVRSFSRLGLTDADCAAILEDSDQELAALRRALGC